MEEIDFCITCCNCYNNCVCDDDTIENLSSRNIRKFQIVHNDSINQMINEKYLKSINILSNNDFSKIELSIINGDTSGVMLICEKCKELIPHCEVKNGNKDYGVSLISFCPRCGSGASLIISKEISCKDLYFIYDKMLNASLFHYIKVQNL